MDDYTAPPIELRRRSEEERNAYREEVGEVVLFTVDGVSYGILNAERPHISYGYLRLLRTKGAAVAGPWLMEEVLGIDALEALASMGEDLRPEDKEAIEQRATRIAMGGAGKAL